MEYLLEERPKLNKSAKFLVGSVFLMMVAGVIGGALMRVLNDDYSSPHNIPYTFGCGASGHTFEYGHEYQVVKPISCEGVIVTRVESATDEAVLIFTSHDKVESLDLGCYFELVPEDTKDEYRQTRCY